MLILNMVEGNIQHYDTMREMSIEDFLIKADQWTHNLQEQVRRNNELEKSM